MSYFNEDQEDYMRSLAAIPPAERCWCGWYRLGECSSCPAGATCADKLAVACPQCRSAPMRPGDATPHLATCPTREPKPPLADPPDEGGDPMDVPIDHTPEE